MYCQNVENDDRFAGHVFITVTPDMLSRDQLLEKLIYVWKEMYYKFYLILYT